MTDQTSEGFGNVPNSSAPFGTVPQGSEFFGNVRQASERTEQHTLTVREVARMFEQAGVPRTERSIINWCQPNRQGIARLDTFFDTNERKYFITPQSVTLAIREEQAKASANGNSVHPLEAEFSKNPEQSASWSGDSAEEEKMQHKIRDLEITNRAKDYFIEQLQEERDSFNDERQSYVEKLMSFSQRVGELQTKLFQLGAPSEDKGVRKISEVSEIDHAAEN